MSGYSGTPLWRKLGLADGMAATVLNPPDGYFDLVAGPPSPTWQELRAGAEFVHLFASSRTDLETGIARVLPDMARDGTLWVSWPKKASKVPTDITEDAVREVALPLGLVDVKVAAIDAVWSGLKLVIRKELR